MPDVPGNSPEPAGPAEPDYRFTLANERTFLAWMRTSLALLAAAVALVQFATELGSRTFREACAVALAALATAAAAGGLWRWISVQDAIRRGRPVRRGSLAVAVAIGLAVVGLAVVGALVLELGR